MTLPNDWIGDLGEDRDARVTMDISSKPKCLYAMTARAWRCLFWRTAAPESAAAVCHSPTRNCGDQRIGGKRHGPRVGVLHAARYRPQGRRDPRGIQRCLCLNMWWILKRVGYREPHCRFRSMKTVGDSELFTFTNCVAKHGDLAKP